MRPTSKILVQTAVSLTLALSGAAPAWAGGEGPAAPAPAAPAAPAGKDTDPCTKLSNQCAEDETKAQAAGNDKYGQGVHDAVAAGGLKKVGEIKNNLDASSLDFAQTKDACTKNRKLCQKICHGKDDSETKSKTENCTRLIDATLAKIDEDLAGLSQMSAAHGNVDQSVGGQPQPQPTNPDKAGGDSGGSSMSPMMTGAIAGGLGGLMGYMMGKQAGKKEEKDKLANSGSALQANGSIDCSKQDAYVYSACDSILSNVCSGEMSSGAIASDANCIHFLNRYCSGSGSALPVAYQAPVTNGTALVTSTPSVGAPGEGIGSPICQAANARNFCAQPGRSQCPSCLNLATSSAAACASNPALCMAQNSAAQFQAAAKTCPSDPMFSNPSYAASVGATVAGGQVYGATGGSALPAVVLPQSVSGASSFAVASVSASGDSASGDGAVREGQTRGPASSTGSGASGGSVGASGSVRGSAFNGAVIQSANSGTVGRGPASDVQGQFGPSLFAMGTQVYKSRCQAGKLNNCP